MPIFPLFPINLLAFLLVIDLSLRNVIYAYVLNKQNSQISEVLHLSDLHFDPRYHPTTSTRIRTNGHTFNCHPSEKLVQKGLPMSGPFGGEYSCDSPKLLIEFTISEVHRIVPSPKMIVFTGDSGPHGAEYSKMLKAQFGAVPVIPALGNHDFPNSQMPDEFHPFYKRVFGLWQSLDWLDNAQNETFSRGGYYTRQVSGVTFIADPLGQFAFLDEQLEEAKRRNSFVNIVGHIAAGYKDKKDYKGSMRDEYAEKLAIKFTHFARWIRWLFFGHRHKDTFRVIKDPATGQALLTMFLSPSINTYKQKNFPAFRVFEYNSSNWQFVDIKKWALGLLEVRRAENGTGVHVFKDYYKKQKVGMPLPEGTPPANLVGFERITIRYMDANVIAFLHRIRPLFKAGIAFKVADRRCLNTLADQIFPFVKLIINNITLMHFGDFPFSNGVDLVRHQMEQLQSLVSPTILLNCANLRMIYSMYFFPIGQAMFDWLHTPREDGRPKVLLCPFTRATLDKLKEKFLNATGAVNWIVLFPFIYPDEEEELFVLTNGRTRERMTFGHPFLHPRGNWAIVRAPIARDEKQWAEWEDEAVCGDETIRRNCIDISIPGVDIE
uniref:Metallophos domain-containing protein n=1 Tax=Globodera pallida TaxID=36090 RepID=A0A183BIS5_GLOPA